MDKSYKILILLISSPFVLMLLHIIFVRADKFMKTGLSTQSSLVLCSGIMNVPFLWIVYALNGSVVSLLYSFIVLNSLSYSYFHFFNMSETARRIRLLTELKQRKSISPESIAEGYKGDAMISKRLDRLVSLGQIRLDDGKYHLSGRTLWVGAVLVRIWRTLLNIK